MYTLIATAKLNNVDPQAWLADALHRIADHPARRFKELLPWTGTRRRSRTPSPRKIPRRCSFSSLPSSLPAGASDKVPPYLGKVGLAGGCENWFR